MKRFCALTVVALGAIAFSVSPSFGTTTPTQHYTALVQLTSTGIKLFQFVGYRDSPYGDLAPTSGPVPRGTMMNFTVLNKTKKRQNFAILGHKTPQILPGHKAYLHVVFLVRGKFRYESTVVKGADSHNVIVVV